MRSDIFLMRERTVRVICNFKYFRVGSFTVRGSGWKKPKYSLKDFVEERAQKHQGKKIPAKLLVTKNDKQIIIVITKQKSAKI